MTVFRVAAIAGAALAVSMSAQAQGLSNVSFVNGLTIPGDSLDWSAGSTFDRRQGFFSDLYYDSTRKEWWALSDRGPGGGTLPYETRVQRFTLDIGADGSISNYKVLQTIKFSNAGTPLNGLAPNPSSALGPSFDPEGFVVNPATGNLLVSDEYGPSVYEFDRSGNLLRAFKTPANLIPMVGATVDYNNAPPTQTTGRENNRGLEGLAISPDGRYAYAILQNGTVADGWTSSGRGQYTRIVKYDTLTGEAVGQYAYKLQSSGQGRGMSAIVALGNDKFLVIERNNRGIGVGATVGSPDKNVYEVDLTGASDVSGINLPASGDLPSGVVAATKGAKVIDLDADKLAALNNISPEKWEGLTIGPKLANGKYLVLAGTDNDYSVTQNGSNVQFDVYLKMDETDPYAKSIYCPLGQVVDCFQTDGNSPVAALPATGYALLPGVLHAYTANVDGYITPVPEPGTWALMLGGLAAVGALARRRRAAV